MHTTIISFFLVFLISSCGQTGNKETSSDVNTQFEGEASVMVYYFHGNQRCMTCLAIQKVTEDAYTNQLSGNQKVKYKEVDISLKENAALAEKYEIVWSSLVIASESGHTNLTDKAFGLAVNNPDSLKELIVSETNALLNN